MSRPPTMADGDPWPSEQASWYWVPPPTFAERAMFADPLGVTCPVCKAAPAVGCIAAERRVAWNVAEDRAAAFRNSQPRRA